MQNLSKTHEKNVQTSVQTEQVSNILDNVENTPFALRGANVKSILYWLFCLIAAVELSAALFFYVASLGTPQAVAAVGAIVIGFALHGLLHSLLTDTTKGMVFSKMRESKAMSNEVKTNIVLSITLLITVALIVFFVGKKGFTAYRGHQYELAQNEAKPKEAAKGLEITASMLTNKKGKISSDKLEQLAAVTSATAKNTESKTASMTADRESYDATTAQMTDIVGASAFVLELLLALLAFSIATAKYAAVFDEIARRNGASQPSQQAQQANNTTAQNTPSVTGPTNTQQPNNTGKEFSFNNQIEFIKLNIVGYYLATQKALTLVDTVVLRQAFEQVNPTITDMGNNCFQFDEAPILTAYKALIEPLTTPPTTAPIQPKQIGFSDNKANEGRAVIKGFQQQPKALTANNEALTAKKQPLTANNESKVKMCLYCEKEFIYRAHNQKYCGEECRICAWNEKLGKQLRETTQSVNGK